MLDNLLIIPCQAVFTIFTILPHFEVATSYKYACMSTCVCVFAVAHQRTYILYMYVFICSSSGECIGVCMGMSVCVYLVLILCHIIKLPMLVANLMLYVFCCCALTIKLPLLLLHSLCMYL